MKKQKKQKREAMFGFVHPCKLNEELMYHNSITEKETANNF